MKIRQKETIKSRNLINLMTEDEEKEIVQKVEINDSILTLSLRYKKEEISKIILNYLIEEKNKG